jgi:murein DD-endopeptidase MepM/ murein hydrolase activator NlpD
MSGAPIIDFKSRGGQQPPRDKTLLVTFELDAWSAMVGPRGMIGGPGSVLERMIQSSFSSLSFAQDGIPYTSLTKDGVTYGTALAQKLREITGARHLRLPFGRCEVYYRLNERKLELHILKIFPLSGGPDSDGPHTSGGRVIELVHEDARGTLRVPSTGAARAFASRLTALRYFDLAGFSRTRTLRFASAVAFIVSVVAVVASLARWGFGNDQAPAAWTLKHEDNTIAVGERVRAAGRELANHGGMAGAPVWETKIGENVRMGIARDRGFAVTTAGGIDANTWLATVELRNQDLPIGAEPGAVDLNAFGSNLRAEFHLDYGWLQPRDLRLRHYRWSALDARRAYENDMALILASSGGDYQLDANYDFASGWGGTRNSSGAFDVGGLTPVGSGRNGTYGAGWLLAVDGGPQYHVTELEGVRQRWVQFMRGGDLSVGPNGNIVVKADYGTAYGFVTGPRPTLEGSALTRFLVRNAAPPGHALVGEDLAVRPRDSMSNSFAVRLAGLAIDRAHRTTVPVGVSLYASALKAGVPSQVARELDAIFSAKLDPASDRFQNATVEVFFVDKAIPDRTSARVEYAVLRAGDLTLPVYLFASHAGQPAAYYDAAGTRVGRILLPSPVEVDQDDASSGAATSGATGLDFSVPFGTAIVAAGTGNVTAIDGQARTGFDLKVEIGGGVGFVYQHLSRLAPGVRLGATIRQGDLVGYSGGGNAKVPAPLHYEAWQEGVTINPLTLASAPAGGLSGDALRRFVLVRRAIDVAVDAASLDSDPGASISP